MGGGGGKGGSKSSSVEIPSWVSAPASRNLSRAETAQKVGYMPYYGADVAAFTPTQLAGMQSNIGAAEAFGLVDPASNLTANSNMPAPTTFANGVQGYSAGPLFDQAVAELAQRRPGQVAQYNKLFVDPQSTSGSMPGVPDGYAYAKNSITGEVKLVPNSQVGSSFQYTAPRDYSNPFWGITGASKPKTGYWEGI